MQDVAPTILSALGVETGRGFDGRDLGAPAAKV
jgi:arylsulfatase A-like enzyme